MINQNKKSIDNVSDASEKNQEEIKIPEKKVSSIKDLEAFDWRKERKTEEKEVSPYDKIVSAKLRQEIEKMELDEKSKGEIKKKAEKIEYLGEKEKIEHLLKIAKEKGVVFAVQVAIKTNDPYILDVLHDILSQEGFYLKMGKANDD